MRCYAEILIDPPMNPRGEVMLQALADCAPPTTVVTRTYRGDSRLLILYGVGLKQRLSLWQHHIRRGGHVVMFDMGYWNRGADDMRLSIDSLHPTAVQLAASPAESRQQLVLQDVEDQAGPILLIGMGRKSCALHGLQPQQWELAKLRELRTKYPRREILWRPKGRAPERFMGLPMRHGMEIEDALVGCALVACRHSNVAINACIAGVPVLCEDGAAYALYSRHMRPTHAQRLDFLSRLSHWNYTPAQAQEAWAHIARMTQ